MISVQSTRAAFAGTPEFAVPGLAALVNAGVAVDFVLTQPDRRAGRGRHLSESPVKQFAAGQGIPVRQPAVLDEDFRHSLPANRPELLVVIAYGLILPEWLLDWPTVAPLNVHASLLPRWRGAAPIQQAILAGDAETGVSVMRMSRGLDAGPVYGELRTPVGPAESAGELHDRLSVLGAELLLDLLPDILSSSRSPEPQDENARTYAPKIEKRDAVLDWERSAAELARKVRAYNPWPVAEARTAAGERLRVWQADALAGGPDAMPGTVVAAANGELDIATGEGLLRLRQVQPPGGRVMDAEAYLAAHNLRDTSFVGPA